MVFVQTTPVRQARGSKNVSCLVSDTLNAKHVVVTSGLQPTPASVVHVKRVW